MALTSVGNGGKKLEILKDTRFAIIFAVMEAAKLGVCHARAGKAHETDSPLLIDWHGVHGSLSVKATIQFELRTWAERALSYGQKVLAVPETFPVRLIGRLSIAGDCRTHCPASALARAIRPEQVRRLEPSIGRRAKLRITWATRPSCQIEQTTAGRGVSAYPQCAASEAVDLDGTTGFETP